MFDLTARQLLARGAWFTLGAVAIAVCSPSIGFTCMAAACTAFYVVASLAFALSLGGQTIAIEGTPYPAWSFFQGLFHNGGVSLALLFLIVVLRSRDGELHGKNLQSWLSSPWGEYAPDGSTLLAERIDMLVWSLAIAHEMKDALLLDVRATLPDAGFVIHHASTVAGALFCLHVPVGKGLVTLNAINAYLGSAMYTIPDIIDFLWPERRRAVRASKCAYYVAMTASNVLAVVIGREFDSLAQERMKNAEIYQYLLLMLVMVRQMPVILGIRCEYLGAGFRSAKKSA